MPNPTPRPSDEGRDEGSFLTRRQGVLSGRILLVAFVIAELACLAVAAMIIFS